MFKVTLPLALPLGKCPSPRFLQELLHLSQVIVGFHSVTAHGQTITGIGRAGKVREVLTPSAG